MQTDGHSPTKIKVLAAPWREQLLLQAPKAAHTKADSSTIKFK